MAARGILFLVTTDNALVNEMAGSDRGKEFELVVSATLEEAEKQMSTRFDRRLMSVMVFDLGSVDEKACRRQVDLQNSRARGSTFFLKPEPDVSASKPGPLRELGWPLPAAFVDEAALVQRPVVFLASRPVFLARAIELSFKPTGIQPVVLQTAEGIAEFIQQSPSPILGKGRGIYGRLLEGLFGKEPEAPQQPAAGPPGIPPSLLGHVVVALFDGTRSEAESLDAKLRASMPEAVCYRVTNADPLVEAGRALENGMPVVLGRGLARHIVPMLVCSDIKSFAPVKVPVLMVDREPDKVADLARALMADGYQVEVVKTEEEALRLAGAKGRFHVVVIGVSFAMSFTYAVDAGPGLARKFHDLDPDLRFVFVMDLYPLERSVREMSRLIELGADDIILKPVEPTRLVMAVDRSVKRRSLAIEQSRLGQAGLVQAAFGQASQTVSLVGGRYDMVLQLGEGGMGIVFLATDRQLGRKVAIKKMRAEVRANAAHRDRFMEEARLVSRLVHPYIVGVHDVLEHRGEIYLVLDFVDGKPLSDLLADKRRMTFDQGRKVLEQVCQGIDFAHRNNILHRDLKPSNIMIDKNGYAKVMDFGLAREFKDAVSMLTQKDAGGTLAYMAPEQHLGRCGKASDVYSLGICWYEMLSGERPFKGPDFLAQKERMHYPTLSSLVPGLPPTTDQVVARVFEPDPHKRISGAAGFYDAVRAL
ncbi:MAG: protein kinase [Elusimicrobia bacterium]|nr:protein kinase [Elusimicrobiota bacterium]